MSKKYNELVDFIYDKYYDNAEIIDSTNGHDCTGDPIFTVESMIITIKKLNLLNEKAMQELREYHKKNNEKIYKKIKKIVGGNAVLTDNVILYLKKFIKYNGNLDYLKINNGVQKFEEEFIKEKFSNLSDLEKLDYTTSKDNYINETINMIKETIHKNLELLDLVKSYKEEK